MLDRLDKTSMNELVVGFEQIEPGNQARVQLPELGEVDAIFDPVVLVEMLQEGIEPRNEGLL